MTCAVHSVAPFDLDTATFETPHVIYDARGGVIARLPRNYAGQSVEEQTANAVLFTEAPELLAAAKGLVKYLIAFGGAKASVQPFNRLVGAIAKAEGRDP